MSEAIGLIETEGLYRSVEAADAMAKAANITIVKTIRHRRRVDPHGHLPR